jgi:septal ring factor EnvC (AmiA/AmiB activator)
MYQDQKGKILVVRYEKGDSKVCCYMRQLSKDQGMASEAHRVVAAIADSSMEMG